MIAESCFDWILMDVSHDVANTLWVFDVKSGLPNRALANIKCDGSFIYSHHFRDRASFRHVEQKMNMIRHDNECE